MDMYSLFGMSKPVTNKTNYTGELTLGWIEVGEYVISVQYDNLKVGDLYEMKLIEGDVKKCSKLTGISKDDWSSNCVRMCDEKYIKETLNKLK